MGTKKELIKYWKMDYYWISIEIEPKHNKEMLSIFVWLRSENGNKMSLQHIVNRSHALLDNRMSLRSIKNVSFCYSAHWNGLDGANRHRILDFCARFKFSSNKMTILLSIFIWCLCSPICREIFGFFPFIKINC